MAIRGSEWCPAHHPDYQEQRKRAAKKGGRLGGRGRSQTELAEIKALLADLTDQVLTGTLETGPAAVANQLTNTRLRAIELERKIKETEELEERLEAIEATLKGRKAG